MLVQAHDDGDRLTGRELHGPHFCLGAALARQEAEVALAALFGRFPDLALAAQPEWKPVPGVAWLSRLPVLLHGTTRSTHTQG